MIRHFLKIAWRNLAGNKVYSFINIAGLAAGMAVAMLIGLWIHDEVNFRFAVLAISESARPATYTKVTEQNVG